MHQSFTNHTSFVVIYHLVCSNHTSMTTQFALQAKADNKCKQSRAEQAHGYLSSLSKQITSSANTHRDRMLRSRRRATLLLLWLRNRLKSIQENVVWLIRAMQCYSILHHTKLLSISMIKWLLLPTNEERRSPKHTAIWDPITGKLLQSQEWATLVSTMAPPFYIFSTRCHHSSQITRVESL